MILLDLDMENKAVKGLNRLLTLNINVDPPQQKRRK
jgi:hypothetical protein